MSGGFDFRVPTPVPAFTVAAAPWSQQGQTQPIVRPTPIQGFALQTGAATANTVTAAVVNGAPKGGGNVTVTDFDVDMNMCYDAACSHYVTIKFSNGASMLFTKTRREILGLYKYLNRPPHQHFQ